jgi:hypothetical protein
MFSKIKKFIIVEFDDVSGSFDWPKELPIPRIGEELMIEGYHGTVNSVFHNWNGSFYELRIRVSKIVF